MSEKAKYIKITELDFGYFMIGHKNAYPLEVVGSVIFEDENGVFYIPTVTNYCESNGQHYTTGDPDGYETREQLLRCIGRCWDKASEDIKRVTNELQIKNKGKK